MEKNKKIKILFDNSPTTCVYGNFGDYSRYKLLQCLTDSFFQKELLLNQEFKDQINVFVYPCVISEKKYLFRNGKFDEIGAVDVIDYQTGDAVYVPGNYNNNKMYLFPAATMNDLPQMIIENIFVESFPYGKQEFIEYILKTITAQGITCENKIFLYEDGRKYGATDITGQEAGFQRIYEKISKYVSGIYSDVNALIKASSICVAAQYKKKKRAVLNDCKERFENGYESEFEYSKQRWMCNEEKRGILTESAFDYISDYKRVKTTDSIEKKMFDNLIKHIKLNEKEITSMINWLYFSYVGDLVSFPENYIRERHIQFINEIRAHYKFEQAEKCPESPLDFRVICSKKQYVIRLRTYLNQMVDNYFKNMIKSDICKHLEKCEVKYCG